MTGRPGGEDGRAATPGGTGSAGAGPAEGRPAAQLLADRVAAALVRHEPGWRLPRRSALARRHGVSPAEMAAAIEELSARRLVRRLPDGQVYRASPADYLIRLEGLPELRVYGLTPPAARALLAERSPDLGPGTADQWG